MRRLLLYDKADIDREPALNWVARTVAELEALPDLALLNPGHRGGLLRPQCAGHCRAGARARRHAPRQRLWKVRAKQVVLATGALERPLVFGGNDRPGVMLAGATRAYLNRYAVAPGSRAVIFTNNDSAYATAADLKRSGVEVAAIVDARAGTLGAAPRLTAAGGIARLHGQAGNPRARRAARQRGRRCSDRRCRQCQRHRNHHRVRPRMHVGRLESRGASAFSRPKARSPTTSASLPSCPAQPRRPHDRPARRMANSRSPAAWPKVSRQAQRQHMPQATATAARRRRRSRLPTTRRR
jgi:hypothetical protein